MILRRLGNKKKIASKIQKHFPPHDGYVEPFFGAGGMFFNKPKAKYNALNDIDNDVFNLFMVVRDRKEELIDAFLQTPVHDSLFQYWRRNEETDPIWKAVRFLHLSSFGYMGKSETLSGGIDDNRSFFFTSKIEETQKQIKDCVFFSCDFEKFFKGLKGHRESVFKRTLIYCDPPYLSTGHNYQQGFSPEDTGRLFRVCREMATKGYKVAISEFDNHEVCEIADKYGFEKIVIGERKSMKNRSTEVLFTSYKSTQLSLF